MGYIQITPALLAPSPVAPHLPLVHVSISPAPPTPTPRPTTITPIPALPWRTPLHAAEPLPASTFPLPTTAKLLQRTAIFYVYVKIRGRTCKLIVDSGSCINVVSKDTAAQLGLTLVPHPAPYNVSWIDASTLPVKSQCLIPLKMSTYEDSVLCDVLPMQISSIILGRPWLCDHDVMLNGRANSCSFLFRGRRVLWYPPVRVSLDSTPPGMILPTQVPLALADQIAPTAASPETSPPRPKYPIIMNGCIFIRDLEKAIVDIPFWLALTYEVPPSDPPPEHDAPELAHLMTNFRYVFSDKLPSELPPMRSI